MRSLLDAIRPTSPTTKFFLALVFALAAMAVRYVRTMVASRYDIGALGYQGVDGVHTPFLLPNARDLHIVFAQIHRC